MHRDGHVVLEREPPVPGDVVGVCVRLEHPHDLHAFRRGCIDVLLDPLPLLAAFYGWGFGKGSAQEAKNSATVDEGIVNHQS